MTIPTLTDAPSNPQRSDPENFREKADLYVNWHTQTNVPELNSVVDELNRVMPVLDSTMETAVSAANLSQVVTDFYGEWSDLTGSLSVPAFVLHDGSYWMLTTDLADVTTSEPSIENSDWVLILPAVTGAATLIPGSVSHEGYLTLDGSVVSKSAYPRLADIDEFAYLPAVKSTNSQSIFESFFIISAIAYGNSRFVCVGGTGIIAYSSDGYNWTEAADSDSILAYATFITYGGSKFVCGASFDQIAYSSDGDTWTAATGCDLGIEIITSIAYGNSKFVCVGASGQIAYSSDGDTWTAATDSESVFGSSKINRIASDGSKFVCVGDSGEIAYSSDGDTWNVATNSEHVFGNNSISQLIVFDSNFYAIDKNASIAVSTDGDLWELINTSDLYYLSGFAPTFSVTDGTRMIFGYSLVDAAMTMDCKIIQQYYSGQGYSDGIYGAVFADGKFVFGGQRGLIFCASVDETSLYLPKVLSNSLLVGAIKLNSDIYESTAIAYSGATSNLDEDIETTTLLTWGYTAGKVRYDNTITDVSAGTIELTDDATNYIEVNSTGVVSTNTSGFTSASVPVRVVTTSGGEQISSTDRRSWLTIANTWDGDITDVNITGGTDIGANLADVDLILVDDGASGTIRKSEISRLWTYIQSKIGAAGSAYDVGGTYNGLPTGSLTLIRYPMPRAVTFPASLTGSRMIAETSATAETVFSLKKNGTEFGTATFAASGTYATFAAASETNFSAGDILTIVSPLAADATLADLGWAIVGSK